MDSTWEARILAVAALEEPTRRRLYELVVRRAGLVSRDEAAAAVGLPRSTAAFHLDRLTDEGLLEVVYERRSGRTGPGSGRPSKLYRRSDRHLAVSLPERRYDLAGRLLAAAIEDAESSGETPRAALDRRAYQLGSELAAPAGDTAGDETGNEAGVEERQEAVIRLLDDHGFEPRAEENAIVLGNCPFHTLARQHTDLVCQMNRSLQEGVLAGLGITHLHARLDPMPGQCCVRLEPRPT